MLIQLAWRNIWRNKRRTLITLASILFAVLFASAMEALQKGAWNNMIRNVVNFHTGYVQVHQLGYRDEQTLDLAFSPEQVPGAFTAEIPGVRAVLPRLESFALASTGANTMGVMVTGIDPETENSMTHLRDRLIEGSFLQDSDREVLIAAGIAENLKLQTGDTLLLISQGYHGVNAAGKYPVKGIIRYPSPDLNRLLVFLPLKEAQWFYGAEGMVTTLAYHLNSEKAIPGVIRHLENVLPREQYEVLDWPAMLPDLLEAKKLDSAGNVIMYFILYLIIAFGLFGTILMMTRERQYEFGLLVAVGMKRRLLGAVVWIEVLMLGMLGALAGILVSIPIIAYFHKHPLVLGGDYSELMEKFGFEPIFPAEFSFNIFFTQALVVFVLTALMAFLPFRKISRLKPVEAMRS